MSAIRLTRREQAMGWLLTIVGAAVVIVVIGAFTMLVIRLGDLLDVNGRQAYEQGRPARVAQCERYSTFAEVPTKYDDDFGCFEKRATGWQKVKMR
jgi:hypothetical protein